MDLTLVVLPAFLIAFFTCFAEHRYLRYPENDTDPQGHQKKLKLTKLCHKNSLIGDSEIELKVQGG